MVKADFEEVLPKLVKIALFNDFDPAKENDRRILKIVYDNVSIKYYKAGEVIINEGDLGDEFYILSSGKVHISKSTLSGDALALADLDDSMNIFFGETALISNDERTATVTALSDCRVLVLTRKSFDAICEAEPVFGYKVLKVLAGRMSNTIRGVNKDKAVLYEALFNEISMSS
ncbi:cyclic nucleotide-binding domain-containing protein [Treponema sp.]|uniref:cyclic nucleotide-binding domain-containing protein n=1 Tax=Treponema sp. TaxID=166 RepID=UPI00298DC4DB|nr:cyclic nucleotide-binding domain-containing protein [Treponema sp.]MCQ2241265.1 cyclic nucleotide-binding domain-containing protein [Treponema sp.]